MHLKVEYNNVIHLYFIIFIGVPQKLITVKLISEYSTEIKSSYPKTYILTPKSLKSDQDFFHYFKKVVGLKIGRGNSLEAEAKWFYHVCK